MTKTEMLMAKSMGAGRSLKRKDKMNDDQISRQAALDCVTYDVEYTTERIKALPFLQPTCNQLATDLISRQEAIKAVEILLEQTEEDVDVKIWNNAIRGAINSIKHHVSSAQPDVPDTNVGDMVSRAAAIDILDAYQVMVENGEENPYALARLRMSELPSAQPERLTDDDFETIRIHLNAYKEKLCNQQRWEEAKEYQYIIDRFMAFASAQPEEVIPHRNYKYLSDYWCECGWHLGKKGEVKYCSECGRKVNWDG